MCVCVCVCVCVCLRAHPPVYVCTRPLRQDQDVAQVQFFSGIFI